MTKFRVWSAAVLYFGSASPLVAEPAHLPEVLPKVVAEGTGGVPAPPSEPRLDDTVRVGWFDYGELSDDRKAEMAGYLTAKLKRPVHIERIPECSLEYSTLVETFCATGSAETPAFHFLVVTPNAYVTMKRQCEDLRLLAAYETEGNIFYSSVIIWKPEVGETSRAAMRALADHPDGQHLLLLINHCSTSGYVAPRSWLERSADVSLDDIEVKFMDGDHNQAIARFCQDGDVKAVAVWDGAKRSYDFDGCPHRSDTTARKLVHDSVVAHDQVAPGLVRSMRDALLTMNRDRGGHGRLMQVFSGWITGWGEVEDSDFNELRSARDMRTRVSLDIQSPTAEHTAELEQRLEGRLGAGWLLGGNAAALQLTLEIHEDGSGKLRRERGPKRPTEFTLQAGSIDEIVDQVIEAVWKDIGLEVYLDDLRVGTVGGTLTAPVGSLAGVRIGDQVLLDAGGKRGTTWGVVTRVRGEESDVAYFFDAGTHFAPSAHARVRLRFSRDSQPHSGCQFADLDLRDVEIDESGDVWVLVTLKARKQSRDRELCLVFATPPSKIRPYSFSLGGGRSADEATQMLVAYGESVTTTEAAFFQVKLSGGLKESVVVKGFPEDEGNGEPKSVSIFLMFSAFVIPLLCGLVGGIAAFFRDRRMNGGAREFVACFVGGGIGGVVAMLIVMVAAYLWPLTASLAGGGQTPAWTALIGILGGFGGVEVWRFALPGSQHGAAAPGNTQ